MELQDLKDKISEFYSNDTGRPPEDTVDDLVELKEYIDILIEALDHGEGTYET